jgi:uncharacterized ferredoxin-like protein
MAFSIKYIYKAVCCYIIVFLGIKISNFFSVFCGSCLFTMCSGFHALVGVLNELINGHHKFMFIC